MMGGRKTKFFHPLISFNIKNLHIPNICCTFALSINDKGKGNTLEYNLQHILFLFVKKCLKLTSFNKKVSLKFGHFKINTYLCIVKLKVKQFKFRTL